MINFNNIKATEEKVSNFKMVKPGFQKIKITALEPIVARSGSSGYNVTFEDTEGASFKQGWFLRNASGEPNIKVLESFQYLAETFTGSLLTGELSDNDIAAALVGTVAEITVGEERRTTEKDGKKYNNSYARIPFGGYKGQRNIQISGSWDNSESTTPPNASDVVLKDTQANDGLPF